MSKQTAVEWLMLEKALVGYIDDEMVQQAKELFEQQIKDAYVFGFKECEKIHEEAFFIQDLSEQYYKKTYKPST
jgi:hypothetical protein